MVRSFIYLLIACLVAACTSRTAVHPTTLFSLLPADATGVDFANNLKFSEQLNMYTFRNFYNGGGARNGEHNNKCPPENFFLRNQGPNKPHLKKYQSHFADITPPGRR